MRVICEECNAAMGTRAGPDDTVIFELCRRCRQAIGNMPNPHAPRNQVRRNAKTGDEHGHE